MIEIALYAFTALFVVLDPIGTAVLFAAMTRHAQAERRRQMASKAVLLAGLILLLFAFAGEVLLNGLGISLPAFRIAGGLLLFLLAADMVFARPSGLRATTAEEDAESIHRHDLSVFPLAFPLIAGPGAMTTVVLLIGRAGANTAHLAAVVGVLLLVLLLMLGLFLNAGRVERILGVTGSNVVSRVLGIILAALAVQFVLDGIRQSFLA
jgi:multiple antibiotic resistance protein